MKTKLAALLCLLMLLPACAWAASPAPLSDTARYGVNVFLSNFSEQGITRFDPAEALDAQLAEFAALHIRINRSRYVEASDKAGYNARVSDAYIRDVAEQYTGRRPQSLAPVNLTYENGYYYFSEGAPIDIGFVSMSAAEELDEGVFGIYFGCYGAGWGWSNEDCRLRPEQAAAKYWDAGAPYTGYAVIDTGMSGLEADRSAWRLIDYRID